MAYLRPDCSRPRSASRAFRRGQVHGPRAMMPVESNISRPLGPFLRDPHFLRRCLDTEPASSEVPGLVVSGFSGGVAGEPAMAQNWIRHKGPTPAPLLQPGNSDEAAELHADRFAY